MKVQSMIRLLWLLLVICFACSEENEFKPQDPQKARGIKRSAAVPKQTASSPSRSQKGSSSLHHARGDDDKPAKAPHYAYGEDEASESATALKKSERDLEAELRRLVLGQGRCLPQKEVNEAQEAVELKAEINVTGTGIITRAEVRASGLSQGAEDCLEKAISSSKLLSPVPGAPRRVSVTVRFEKRPLQD